MSRRIDRRAGGVRCELRWLVLALAATVPLACAEEVVEAPDLRPSVSVTEVRSFDLDVSIRASGELKALSHAEIAAEIEGRITGIPIEEGLEAAAGAIVIEIDPARRALERDAARANLARAKATLARERSAAERVRELGKQRIASAEQLEEAETKLLMARAEFDARRAELASAERALADASVSAPFAGHVSRRDVQLGQFVQKGEPLFELVALDPLEVEFSVPERDANRVRNGQPVSVEVGPLPDRRFPATVTFVSPTVDPQTRTLRLRARLENADGVLRPGLFARVDLGVARREGVTMVPEQSIVQRATGASVFKVLPDARVERIAVETGIAREGWVEVSGGVAPGERIVERGPGRLADGAVVRIVDGAGTPEAPALAGAAEPAGGGS